MDRESSFCQITVGGTRHTTVVGEAEQTDNESWMTRKGGRKGMRETRMYRARELMYRICLGILKTDQWKPNSKMKQGKFSPTSNQPLPLLMPISMSNIHMERREREEGLERYD
jgi:hypothetical protein